MQLVPVEYDALADLPVADLNQPGDHQTLIEIVGRQPQRDHRADTDHGGLRACLLVLSQGEPGRPVVDRVGGKAVFVGLFLGLGLLLELFLLGDTVGEVVFLLIGAVVSRQPSSSSSSTSIPRSLACSSNGASEGMPGLLTRVRGWGCRSSNSFPVPRKVRTPAPASSLRTRFETAAGE